ncbi:GMC family oxidoreductase [Nocardia sp. NPDC057663]|uniref:GMC family oxidoreductase n=1 Tax=Nocardia sp. NPDC057663 TaxID=3346201 RepID=UPI00366D7D82
MSDNSGRVEEFDYVVVGAGSAGCVVAARLSEDPRVRVALIEAGGADIDPGLRVPLHSVRQFGSAGDWGYRTVPQAGMHGRALDWPRGRVLGGSSTMNFQMWVPGYPADFDDWVAAAGETWAWKLVSPALRRAERWAGPPADGFTFGMTGPQWVSPPRDPDPSTLRFVEACVAAGLPEIMGGLGDLTAAGCAITPLTQRHGSRFSVADAYLAPARHRENLVVFTDRPAQRVRLDEHRRAVAVELDGRLVTARREIVLCAGTIGSPQLLMRSGIGPRDQLESAGVRPLVDLPGVGANLHDHVIVNLAFAAVGPDRFAEADSAESRRLYTEGRLGPLTSNIGEAVAFLPSPGSPSPDLELIWSPIAFGDEGFVSGRTLSVVLLRPHSRGSITLTDAGSGSAPRIDPGYLIDPADLAVLIRGFRVAQRLLRTEPLSGVIGDALGELPTTDEEVARFVRDTATTIFHPVGTCRMGFQADAGAVVDPALRVHAVDGLRVADASVIPVVPRGHTNAHAVLIGERAAELISSPGAHGRIPLRAER